MGQIAVISGPERRRRWSDEERVRVLAEAFLPGACVAEVARRHDMSTSLIYTWRRKLRDAAAATALPASVEPAFVEAAVVEDGGTAARPGLCPAIVIDLARDKRVSIFASASPAMVATVLKGLR